MKQIKLLIGTLFLSSSVFAQLPPQGTPPANNTAAKANAAWYRGGNGGGNGNGNQAMNQNNSNGSTKSSIEVELNDVQNIVLEQNVPNPFAERTTISYSIPDNVQKAQIHFYNQNGQLINTVEINERGEGQLNVFANDLSTGVYTYTLIADGSIVSSKRMVRTK